jgi:hypothetical protein
MGTPDYLCADLTPTTVDRYVNEVLKSEYLNTINNYEADRYG